MKHSIPRSSKLSLVWFLLMFVAGTFVQASVAPAISVLSPLETKANSPTRVASDAQGKTYITDTTERRLVVLDAFNHVFLERNESQSPLGIAVDHAGNIYLGEAGTGSVSIFDSHGSLMTQLGQGAGEFSLPNYIALDEGTSPTTVYVSDSPANILKVYQNGTLIRTLGGPDSSSAKFDFPAGVWVNAAGDVFCADQNHVRVLVFDRAGEFLRGFNMGLWNTPGFVGRPAGVTGDNHGRVFVADTFQDFVKVFDEQGTLLDTFSGYGEEPGQLRSPAGIAIDPRGRLLVASLNNSRVEVFGLDGFVLLTTAPEHLTATADDALVTLNWAGLEGATSYNVKRTTTSGGPYTNVINVVSTKYIDLNVTNGTKYFYVISGLNSSIESPDSVPASAQPVSLQPLTLTMNLTSGQLQFSWPADHLGWRLQMNTNLAGSNWIDIAATATSTSFSVPATNDNLFFRLTYP